MRAGRDDHALPIVRGRTYLVAEVLNVGGSAHVTLDGMGCYHHEDGQEFVASWALRRFIKAGRRGMFDDALMAARPKSALWAKDPERMRMWVQFRNAL